MGSADAGAFSAFGGLLGGAAHLLLGFGRRRGRRECGEGLWDGEGGRGRFGLEFVDDDGVFLEVGVVPVSG